jgi:hypothetical protein
MLIRLASLSKIVLVSWADTNYSSGRWVASKNTGLLDRSAVATFEHRFKGHSMNKIAKHDVARFPGRSGTTSKHITRTSEWDFLSYRSCCSS